MSKDKLALSGPLRDGRKSAPEGPLSGATEAAHASPPPSLAGEFFFFLLSTFLGHLP